jgi:hypothetical protein
VAQSRRELSGFQKRKQRVARGLPRYTEQEARTRKADDRRRTLQRYRERRAYIDRLKVETGCSDCGYNANPVALQFDHLPGNEKVADIARLAWLKRSMSSLLAEIAKCEVVCANCHAIRTFNRGWPGRPPS